MLRSLYNMFDYRVAATEGDVGRVHDFLFDDESWIVHYLVVETPGALEKRKVLILPFAVGRPEWETRRLPVLLTAEEVRTSPPLEADLPIARQFETGVKRPGSHLRSVREVLGYSIHTAEGDVGSVEDFIIEDTLWGVHHAVVALRQLPLRSVLLSPESIRSISWLGKAAWVNLSREEIAKNPDFDAATAVNRDNDHRLYDYYGRPVYAPPPFASENRPETQQY